MAYVHGPAAADRLGSFDSLEGFTLGARRLAPAPASPPRAGRSVGSALSAARGGGAPPRLGAIARNPVSLNAPQLQPAAGEGTVAVLVAAPASPVIRRAFRAMSADDRAQAIAHLSRATGLSGYELEQYSADDLAGLSFKSIGKAFSNVGKAVGKAVTQTGHVVGNAVTSKIGQAVIGTGLALTGVGLPAAAAIGAAAQAGGGLIKSGGGLKAATTGALVGGAEGAAASLAGSAIRKFAPNVTNTARDVGNALLPGNPFSRIATSTAAATGTPAITDVAAIAGAGAGLSVLPPIAAPIPAAAPTIDTVTARAAALPAGGVSMQSPTVQRIATSTLAGGAAANRQAKAAAKKMTALNTKMNALSKALDSAKAAGDALGVTQLSNAITSTQQAIATASNVVATGSDSLRIAGNAIQGGATGAVAGAGAGGIADWISQHKAVAIGAGVAAVGLVAIALAPRGGGSSQPWRYDPRTRGVA